MDIGTVIISIAGGATSMAGFLKFVQMFQDKKTKIKLSQSDWKGVRLKIEELETKTDKHQIMIAKLETEFKIRMEYIQNAFSDINKKLDKLIKLNGGEK